MAGRFEGISDLEWRLFEDIFPPKPEKRDRVRATLSIPPCAEHFTVRINNGMSLVRCSKRKHLGIEKCSPQMVEALGK